MPFVPNQRLGTIAQGQLAEQPLKWKLKQFTACSLGQVTKAGTLPWGPSSWGREPWLELSPGVGDRAASNWEASPEARVPWGQGEGSSLGQRRLDSQSYWAWPSQQHLSLLGFQTAPEWQVSPSPSPPAAPASARAL